MTENKKKYSRAEVFKYSFVTFFMFLLLIVGLGEIITRIVVKEQAYYDKAQIDKTIGWTTKENYKAEYEMKEANRDGKIYPVTYQTEKYGFRAWGDVNSDKQKVFFIGDSYVQSVEVSNDKTFYHYLKDSLDIEVFAYGQAGYGTLQELMILEKYLAEIEPDLIVLQTCDNDFIDNHAPLEYNSSYKVGLRRPYYTTDKKIIYRKAMPRFQEVVDKSKFLGLLRKKISNTFPKEEGPSSQEMMAKENRAYEPYATSIEITSLILSDMKKSAGDIPIIAFSASPYEPQTSAFKEICEANNIPFDGELGKKIEQLVWNKVNVLSVDGYHWNELGQLKVAEFLMDKLSSSLNKTEKDNQ